MLPTMSKAANFPYSSFKMLSFMRYHGDYNTATPIPIFPKFTAQIFFSDHPKINQRFFLRSLTYFARAEKSSTPGHFTRFG